MNKPKLIIHETDYHGCGNIYYNGKCYHYSYDDGAFGDIKTAIMSLQDMGVPFGCDVKIYEGDDIYEVLDEFFKEG